MRRLKEPYFFGKASGRSQAMYAMRTFGPWTAESLGKCWGVDTKTLDAIVAEGWVERVEHKGHTWCRLTPLGETIPWPPPEAA